ncbi:MAG: nuclear transport factor 2 family protein [Pseudomonas sp.]|nr:nuclear transport factor 2 family protein [Pseudomonas sp.]
MQDLERRLKALEDRAELQDLAVRYFIATDDDDYSTLESLFTVDAVFRAGGFTGAIGRAAIMNFLRGARTNMGVTVHTPHYSLISFTGEDRATGVVGAHLEIAMAGQSLFGAVRYIDEYQRLDGRWHFSRREMLAVHMGPWEQVATSLTSDKRVRWPGTDPQPADLPIQGANH